MVYNPTPDVILPDGEHEFSLTITDEAGNVSETFVARVTIDTVFPLISNLSPEFGGFYNQTPLKMSFNAEDSKKENRFSKIDKGLKYKTINKSGITKRLQCIPSNAPAPQK